MGESALILTTIGAVLLLGFSTDAIGRFTSLPRVTLLLLLGILVGPEVLDLLPADNGQWFAISANCALVMVGFLLGERFTAARFRENGLVIVAISATAVLVTAVIVALVLLACGVPPPLAVLLGALSTSTDPAATVDVVREHGADTPFSRVLVGVVAIDDAWALLVFSLVLAMIGSASAGASVTADVLFAFREVGGAVLLGALLGLPLSFLTGRTGDGEPTLIEALGIVFLSGGLALWFEVSSILTAMVLGATVANLAQHHTRPFHAIEGIERPFLILFFVFAGASLHLEALVTIGTVGILYVGARILGRVVGGWLGGALCGSPPATRNWIGLALLPQAGIALGVALLAAERFPDLGQSLLTVAIGATVAFELGGPLCTRYALARAS